MTPLHPNPILTLADFPALGDSLIFQFNGLIVVFTALCSIWVVLEITGAFFRRRAAAPAPAPAAAPVATPSTAGQDPSPEIVAAITAAVHVTLGARNVRITAIAPASTSPDWAREGRREIFSSHRVR